MRSKLSGIWTVALVGIALTASAAFAGDASSSSNAPAERLTFAWKQKQVFKGPIFLPPSPCRKQVCGRPRPR
jgi:hypothetical protein